MLKRFFWTALVAAAVLAGWRFGYQAALKYFFKVSGSVTLAGEVAGALPGATALHQARMQLLGKSLGKGQGPRPEALLILTAESALTLGGNWLNNQIGKPVFPNNNIGLYLPSTTATEVWDSVDWSGSNLATFPNTPGQSGSGNLGKVNTQPKYIIEDLGEIQESGGSLVMSSDYKSKGTTILRVTARGTGGTDAAVVMVQSTYSRAF